MLNQHQHEILKHGKFMDFALYFYPSFVKLDRLTRTFYDLIKTSPLVCIKFSSAAISREKRSSTR